MRFDRIAALIRKELTCIFQKEIADSRLSFITITFVKVSRDLALADILFTQLNLDLPQQAQASPEKQKIVKLLEKAAPRLRYKLAQRLNLRIVPKLRFFYDDFAVKSQHLYNLIDKSVQKD